MRDDMMRRGRPVALLLRCAALACVAAAPIAFSAWIDPARLRAWPDEEHAIARALLAGHNVTDVANYSDRAIEALLVDGRSRAPDVLALGSSRIQPLPASAFPSEYFVNAGVAGAGLDDILAVYALYDTPARRPRHVVLNLDGWTADRDDEAPGWGRLAPQHAAILRRLDDSTPRWRSWVKTDVPALKRISSSEYFRLSVFSFRHYGPAGIRFVVTDREQNDEKTKTPNGTLVWKRTTPEKTDQLVRNYVNRMRRGTAPYNGRDDSPPERLLLLEQFVRYLREEGIEVSLLLVPFHPLAYDEFARRPHNPLPDVESRYRDMARRTGAMVVGSYDPATAGATAVDFFDESHMRPDALTRLVRH
jgi:hypothetical protein